MAKKHVLPLLFLGVACAKADGRVDLETRPVPDAGVEAGPSFAEGGANYDDGAGECEEATKQIFVLGTDKTLYRFDPPTLEFTRIGTVGCATAAGTYSMAINRFGTAYVEFTDGNVFAVDTRTAACKPTPFAAAQTGFEVFGMGYALNGKFDPDAGVDLDAGDGGDAGDLDAGDEAGVDASVDAGLDAGDAGKAPSLGETLYVSGAGLASLDTKSWKLDFKGSLSMGRTELTSQGQQLFAFGVESGVVAELDKDTGTTLQTYRTSAIAERAAFAFAQWGGSFYIFTGDQFSEVTQYTPSTNTSKVVVKNAGILIVGAGSSTCAPQKPPN